MKQRITALLAALPLLAAACRTVAPLSAPGREVAAGRTADRAIEAAIDESKVVLVGESHDDRAHHEFQLDVLRRMSEEGGGPVLLGMEMFQRPWQQHLDDYVAGRIDEREMLRRTEYFSRWSFDHTFYAPLWRLCREKGMRIVALNPAAELHRKANRQGLDALSADERAALPADLDLGVASHRERIMKVFTGGAHPMPPARLEGLYLGQVIWDETMAESAANALLAAGRDARMLVIAGSYHVQEFDGIPDRLLRRAGSAAQPMTVIVMRRAGVARDDDPPDARLGDFVVRTPEDPLGEAPRAGVRLGAPGNVVEDVVKDGLAAKAGLAKGDVLASIGIPGGEIDVRDATDLRMALDLCHEAGMDGTEVTVVRGGARVGVKLVFAAAAPSQ
ncbi:MAG: hypothetical protein HMLKMBBP_01448 [Planctomycetes bacterium]|nr:hypothetical protein [Planctomycetota bacterium]